jgi:hypothetical protein
MTTTWDGAPLTLVQNEQAIMPQTPNGSTILAWRNMSTETNNGTLALITGGQPPRMLNAPALMTAPSILAQNWHAADLRLTNISTDPSTPILIQMFGPGLPGAEPIPLPVGTATMIAPLQTALGRALNFMALELKSNSAELTTIAVIGGPMDSSGNNAYLFALNYPGGAAPPGYTAATDANTYTFQFNWGMSAIFVVNLSGQNTAPIQVLLKSL